jgi:hypothetical protein
VTNKVPTARGGQQSGQCTDDGAIRPGRPWSRDLPTQDSQLMAQHENLHVLGGVRADDQGCPGQESTEDQVHESQCHDRRSCRTRSACHHPLVNAHGRVSGTHKLGCSVGQHKLVTYGDSQLLCVGAERGDRFVDLDGGIGRQEQDTRLVIVILADGDVGWPVNSGWSQAGGEVADGGAAAPVSGQLDARAQSAPNART